MGTKPPLAPSALPTRPGKDWLLKGDKTTPALSSGSFAGGLAEGTAGACVGKTVASFACLSLGALSGSVCAIVIVDTGSFAGSEMGMHRGEYFGEKLYELIEHD